MNIFTKTLYGVDKNGGYKLWHIAVTDDVDHNGYALLCIMHGKEGGTLTSKIDVIKEGKQGRNTFEQAVSEANGRIKKQIDKGYRENKEDLNELPVIAMLAGDYNKIPHRIDWSNPVYESGKRSADLQKYKTFMDAEFEILDVIPDKQGNGVFVVKNDVNDETFTVVMGSMSEREYALKFKHEFIGKLLTVKFQSRYKDTLLPQFGTGVAVRDYE